MKTLLAAGLAALALAATTAATADPIYHPVRHAAVLRAPVVYRSGYVAPRLYSVDYVRHYHRFHHRRHGWRVRLHGPVRHHII